jgi:tetratricopeptide (TPR) repeat protein
MAGYWRACVASWAFLAISLSGAAPAQAQGAPGEEDAREQARAAFSEGIALAEERRWEEAAARFRSAMALHDAPAIRYNLASALFEMGELTEASRALAPVRNDPETPPELATHAEALEAQIRERAALEGVDLDADRAVEDEAQPPDATAEPEPLSDPPPDDGESLLTDFRVWAVVGGVVVVAAVILIAVAASGTEDPVQGNFEPGVLRW